MKTLVSVITGRKDHPVFNIDEFDTNPTKRIVDYMKDLDWWELKVVINSDGYIEVDSQEDGKDVLKVIDVEYVNLEL